DGVLTLLRVEDAKPGADGPLDRRAPRNSEPGRKVLVVGGDQTRAQSPVAGYLECRRSGNLLSLSSPVGLISEVDAFVKVPGCSGTPRRCAANVSRSSRKSCPRPETPYRRW